MVNSHQCGWHGAGSPGRRSPAQRRLRRSPARSPLIEFTVRGGAKQASLGITFGFREGTSHGLLEIKEILPNTAAARCPGECGRAIPFALPQEYERKHDEKQRALSLTATWVCACVRAFRASAWHAFDGGAAPRGAEDPSSRHR